MFELCVVILGVDGYGLCVILCKGGSMSDFYVEKELKRDGNGFIWVDFQLGKLVVMIYDSFKKIGDMVFKVNMGWYNSFFYKGFNLGMMLIVCLGGLVVLNIQGVFDYYGVLKVFVDVWDVGGVWINNGYVDVKEYYQMIGGFNGGLGQYYMYSVINVCLFELSFSYVFFKKWFNNKVGIIVGFVVKNFWMIYCKVLFDLELIVFIFSNFY